MIPSALRFYPCCRLVLLTFTRVVPANKINSAIIKLLERSAEYWEAFIKRGIQMI